MSRSDSVKLNLVASITTFGDLLRYLRRRNQMTQRELALAVGYSISQISRLEQNQRLPDELTLLAVFIPALGLTQEPATVDRLLALARHARGATEVNPAPIETSSGASIPAKIAPPTASKLTNLPQRLTSFIGRDQDVVALQRLVKENRLVTLTGVGGVGKSSLALAVANTIAFPDGIWLLELAPIAEAGLVARLLADLFKLSESPGHTPLEAVINYLQLKSLLLIVDNCEHLIATCADLVDRLLRASATLHILATSREALNIAGECEWPVLPLPTPTIAAMEGAAWPLQQIQTFAAAQLFIERAQAVRANLIFTDQDATLIAHICQQLDGIPLALELAAARCKSFALQEICARLHDRFALLSAGRRTALLRHQTLRATLDWSYDLLSPAEAALFRSLAVFAGGWTVAAAEEVLEQRQGRPPTFDLLHQLVNKSLVVVDQQGATTRYHMLEMLREYALEKLVTQGEEAARREQHAAYFLQLAEEAWPLLYSAEQQAWYQRLLAEQNNFRMALQWGRANHDYAQVARFGAALCWFWLKHGKLREEMPLLEWALTEIERHRATTLPTLQVKALYSVAKGALWLGDLSRARRLFEECLQIEEEPDFWFELTEVLASLAQIVEWESDYPRATILNERYLALSRAHNFTQGVADSLASLGEVMRLQGDYERARQLLQESLVLRKAVGTVTGIAGTQRFLSLAVRELGDFVQAQHLLEDSLQLASGLQDNMTVAVVTTELGVVAQLQHDYQKANHYQQRALTLLRELGFQSYCALALTRLGCLALIQEELTAAHAYFAESLAIAQRIGSKRSVAAGVEGLAGVAALRRQFTQAAQLLGAAETLRQTIRMARPIEERATYERTVALARTALGEAQFEAACRAGRTTALDDVITQALGTTERIPPDVG